MLQYMKVRVFCPLYKCEKTVYCFPLPDGSLCSNRCEDACGSALCVECDAKAADKARIESEESQRGNLLFYQL